MALAGHPTLWTSVSVVYRECLLKRSGEQLPHVARCIDTFLDDRTSTWTLSAVYEHTASLHCMQLLAARRPAVELLYREWEFDDVVAQAARRGDLPSLAWLAESYLPDASLSAAACAAAESGQLHVLTWLSNEHKARVPWGGLEWCGAIRKGQTKAIEWLQQHVAPHRDAILRLVFDAAVAGHSELVRWLLTQFTSVVSRRGAVSTALRGAYKGHRWRIVKLLVTQYNAAPLENCVYAAAKDGDLEFLQRMHASGLVHSFARGVASSAAGGHLDVLKWLYEEAGEQELTADCMNDAASAGHLDVVKWLDAHECPATTIAMDGAATAGFLDVVQWLHEHRAEGCSQFAMDGAAEHGHLQVVKWLHATRGEGCSVSAMEKAARNGHLPVVQWLHAYRSEGCTERAMDWAAKGGHLDVVQWFHENTSAGCTTAAMDWAAYGGHLETVAWLHQHRSEGCTANIVRLAAAGGHLEVLEWLRANKTEALGSDAVDAAAAGGHVQVLRWLHAHGAASCSPSAMRDAVLRGHVPAMLFLYAHYGHDVCQEGICLLSEDWEDTELRSLGMARWLVETFRDDLEGITFSVHRADWATNQWLDERMQKAEDEDEFVFWEGTQST